MPMEDNKCNSKHWSLIILYGLVKLWSKCKEISIFIRKDRNPDKMFFSVQGTSDSHTGSMLVQQVSSFNEKWAWKYIWKQKNLLMNEIIYYC